MDKLVIYIFILMILTTSKLLADSYDELNRQLLVIHSYSPSMNWVEEINSGIEEVVNKEHSLKTVITYEFLDAKRYNTEQYFIHMAQALKFKYSENTFNAIISCDDHALDFMIKYGDRCFPETPVFFCGINDIYREINNAGIKGIYEVNPLNANIELIRKLLPEVRKILIIVDPNTRTNRVHRKRIEEEVISQHKDITIEMTGNISFSDLKAELGSLLDDSAVFYFSYLIDATGEFIPHLPVAEMLLKVCSVPVFTMNKMYLNFDVVGGYVTDPGSHGKAIATMTGDYLRGIPINLINEEDYVTEDLFPAVFNLNQLKACEIDLDKLPNGAIIRENREEIKQNYKQELTLYQLIISIIVIVLIVNICVIIHYSKKLKRKLQSTHRIFEAESAGFLELNKQIDKNGQIYYKIIEMNSIMDQIIEGTLTKGDPFRLEAFTDISLNNLMEELGNEVSFIQRRELRIIDNDYDVLFSLIGNKKIIVFFFRK